MKNYGLFSPELGCFVRLKDISKSKVDPALQHAMLVFSEHEGAVAARPSVEVLSGYHDMEVHELECLSK